MLLQAVNFTGLPPDRENIVSVKKDYGDPETLLPKIPW